jgi:TolA-binding protein
MYLRLGEVDIQREDWAGATAALERGLNKGQLKDAANAQMLMGIALFNQKKLGEAKTWFQRSAQSEKHRQMSRGYLQLIESQT